MLQKKTRLAAAALAALMTITVFTGCTSTKKKNDAATKKPTTSQQSTQKPSALAPTAKPKQESQNKPTPPAETETVSRETAAVAETTIPVGKTIVYSNLNDTGVQAELDSALEKAGISESRRKVFFDHVNQFNTALAEVGLVGKFEEGSIESSQYDVSTMQEVWNAANPNFSGYNCRITTMGLLGDGITIPTDAEIRDSMLAIDLAALKEDASALVSKDEQEQFRVIYSDVPTTATKETAVHVDNLVKDWKSRGISFNDKSSAKMISVIFHDVWDEKDHLFIGHTGVLVPGENGGLYFVEKLGFQEPYQVTKFHSRTELNDYLMTKYNVDFNQPTAAPFVMENDHLMAITG